MIDPTFRLRTLAAALICPSPAGALSIRVQAELMAWSDDGRSALIEERQRGPEGGGSPAYVVLTSSPLGHLRLLMSSDFSPGDGSQPQTVSAAECRRRVGQLAAALARSRFTCISDHVDRCIAPERDGLLVAPDARLHEVISRPGPRRHRS